MWFTGVEVEQETSAPPPKKNPGSAPAHPQQLATKARLNAERVLLNVEVSLVMCRRGLQINPDPISQV